MKTLSVKLERRFPEVIFAYVFGSAREGLIRPGGDVDVAVWVRDEHKKLSLIPAISELVESCSGGAPCDLVFLNNAGDQLSFEVLQGTMLFIREEARELHATFYSRTCREYEDRLAWMKKQLQYRNYEVQWGH